MIMTQDLDVYKKAHQFVLMVYRITAKFPRDEMFGLSAQMKRASVSINSNLMEGGARKHSGDYARFILYSRGSAAELTYQATVAKDLNFITEEEFAYMSNELDGIGKMLSRLLKNISSPQSPVPSPEGN